VIRQQYRDYGDLSAVDPPNRVSMQCDSCRVRWQGCWDNFQCPECGEGQLPNSDEPLEAAQGKDGPATKVAKALGELT
jgi:hypothetical protein